MDKRSSIAPRVGKVVLATAVATLIGGVAAGCLTRPVSTQPPTTKTNFTTVVRSTAIDKVDLLFAIDNSASMGDKQVLFGKAVPDLITRLFTPNCVDDNGNPVGGTADASGKCTQGKAEFPPVHDMHIGIVSSSLGGRGSDSCPPTDTNPTNTALNAHNDDKGHLLNRGGADETAVGAASPSNFLAWLPSIDAHGAATRERQHDELVRPGGERVRAAGRELEDPQPAEAPARGLRRDLERVLGGGRLAGAQMTAHAATPRGSSAAVASTAAATSSSGG